MEDRGLKSGTERRAMFPFHSRPQERRGEKGPVPVIARNVFVGSARGSCQLAFTEEQKHGLPEELDRSRALALAVLPSAAQASVKHETTGSESYLAGSMEFTAGQEPAFRVFNRLVAQVPAVTGVLEYDDVKSAQRRQLRAVDGRIVEHRAV